MVSAEPSLRHSHSFGGSIGNSSGAILVSGNYQGVAYQYGIGGEVDVYAGGDVSYTTFIISGNIYSIGNGLKRMLNAILPDNLKIK